MQKRWDLTYNQLKEKFIAWGKKYGIEDKVTDYIAKREKRRKQHRAKYLRLIKALPILSDELLSIVENLVVPLMKIKTEKDQFKSDYEVVSRENQWKVKGKFFCFAI
ncbi:unnamed protein product [Strongylus vulgaris]|uniref:SXP/RAL-2 family protein Ani s 5-like cation-binding domain-containing protein n=1 Tax=Strongylus vulgaris TaxID=40348 RepID=A0A3P7J8A8_STRVU|nr:unnamed protein product [Strongylus vulgaris]